ncbi:MAG TPA: hypothetical protein VMW24_17365 [Sedimentisphaerales bacterium]|nr:hypothetical protein [Sedimentisphaerales bacterium]
MKCYEVLAWDEWAKKNTQTLDVTTLKAPPDQRQFLENRLISCFQDGVQVGKQIALKRLKRVLQDCIGEAGLT